MADRPDGAERYARSVVEGKQLAGELIIAACERHLNDLETAGARGLRYCPETAGKAARFFPEILRLRLRVPGGTFQDVPFELLPWQDFVIRSVYGWLRADGSRRFRRMYLETAKGSGKTPLTAGMALRSICADGEERGEAYVIARTKDQANVAFREAVAMVKASPFLAARLKVIGGHHAYRIIYAKPGNILERVATEKSGAGHSGPMPHFILADEYHEHADSAMLDLYELGRKSRWQPLTVIPTNAGVDLNASACGLEHQYAAKVAAGTATDDGYFVAIYSVDTKDEPMEDEACWIKANPSLPLLPGLDYIREETARAAGMPSKRSIVERLCFSRWVGAEDPWIELSRWLECEVEELSPEAERAKAPCFVGFDLSTKRDLTAGGVVWDMGTHLEAEVAIWTPQDGLKGREERDNAPYLEWVEAGEIVATPGEVVDYDFVAEWFRGVAAIHDVKWAAYDPWRIDQLKKAFTLVGLRCSRERNRGIQLVPHAQGFRAGPGATTPTKDDDEDKRPQWKRDQQGDHLFMPRSLDYSEKAILGKRLKVKVNRALRSGVLGTVVVPDGKGNRSVQKNKSTTRIDGAVALIMACGAALACRDQGSTTYESWRDLVL